MFSKCQEHGYTVAYVDGLFSLVNKVLHVCISKRERSREQEQRQWSQEMSKDQGGDRCFLQSLTLVNFPFLPTHEWNRPVLAGQCFLALKGCVYRRE